MAENTDTLEILKQLAQQVRNATSEGENTAERVGRTLVGIIDHLGDGDSITEGMLDEKLEDYPTKQEVTIAMSRYVTTDFFARLFAPEGEDGAEVDVNDMEAVITAVRVKFGLHTDSYLSAKGNNPESGSTVAGASALVDLSDVDISNPQDGQILSWNGTKWVNADAPSAGLDEAALAEYLTTNHYAKTTDIPSLEGYATQTWASGQFALKTVAINAGTGLTGGGTLAANRTLSLATVGTAGTYTKVTVDSYGRVTGHGSLAAGDIPALAISKITGLQAALDAKMDAADFEELFEKVYVSGYGYAIRAKLALYTDSWMSAKGNNPESGSTVAGASALVDLSDVDISNPQDGQILSWNGTKWVNADAPSAGLDEAALAEYLTTNHYAKTTDIPSLEGYATQTWASGQFALKTVAINAGTGLTGGGTLAANRTLSLATVGTAGTYTKVTVDSYGRVTGHGSLAAGDIPALAISKITGLQAALDAKMDAADFEELFEKVYVSGYGYAIRAKLALYTDSWMSAKGNNPESGSTVAGASALVDLSDVDISNPQDGQILSWNGTKWVNADAPSAGLDEAALAEYLTTNHYAKTTDIPSLEGYATQSWVNSQGFVKDAFIPRGQVLNSSVDNMGEIGAYIVNENSGLPFGAYEWGTLMTFNSLASGSYGVQMYVEDGVDTKTYLRARYGGSWQSWRMLVETHNIGNYALTPSNYTNYTVTKTGSGASGTWGIAVTGNAGSATKLQTARSINGTAFDGTESITTSKWGMARTLTLKGAVTGSVSIDGSGNVSLETTYATGNIGALDNRYVNVGGDTMTGTLTVDLGSGTKLVLGNGIQIWATSGGWARGLVAYDASGDSALANGSICGAYGSGNTLQYTYYGGTYNSPAMVIRGGNVGIGTTSPSHKLHVAGGIYSSDYLQVGSARLMWDSANNALYVQKSDGTQCGFYATGFMSAKGLNSDGGSAVAGATTLNGLSDVTISSPSNGQSLVYRNGVWKNEMVSGGGSASVNWDDINGKPTWIPDTDGSGSGIDADLLDGTHKSGLFTAMTYSGSTLSITIGGTRRTATINASGGGASSVSVSSSSSRNISVTVDGHTDYVSDVYATYLDGTPKNGLFTGMSFTNGNTVNCTIGGVTRSAVLSGMFTSRGQISESLDNITVNGIAVVNQNSGRPPGSYEWGLVLTCINGSYGFQIYIEDSRNTTYVRTRYGGGWKSWSKIGP